MSWTAAWRLTTSWSRTRFAQSHLHGRIVSLRVRMRAPSVPRSSVPWSLRLSNTKRRALRLSQRCSDPPTRLSPQQTRRSPSPKLATSKLISYRFQIKIGLPRGYVLISFGLLGLAHICPQKNSNRKFRHVSNFLQPIIIRQFDLVFFQIHQTKAVITHFRAWVGPARNIIRKFWA